MEYLSVGTLKFGVVCVNISLNLRGVFGVGGPESTPESGFCGEEEADVDLLSKVLLELLGITGAGVLFMPHLKRSLFRTEGPARHSDQDNQK